MNERQKHLKLTEKKDTRTMEIDPLNHACEPPPGFFPSMMGNEKSEARRFHLYALVRTGRLTQLPDNWLYGWELRLRGYTWLFANGHPRSDPVRDPESEMNLRQQDVESVMRTILVKCLENGDEVAVRYIADISRSHFTANRLFFEACLSFKLSPVVEGVPRPSGLPEFLAEFHDDYQNKMRRSFVRIEEDPQAIEAFDQKQKSNTEAFMRRMDELAVAWGIPTLY